MRGLTDLEAQILATRGTTIEAGTEEEEAVHALAGLGRLRLTRTGPRDWDAATTPEGHAALRIWNALRAIEGKPS